MLYVYVNISYSSSKTVINNIQQQVNTVKNQIDFFVPVEEDRYGPLSF